MPKFFLTIFFILIGVAVYAAEDRNAELNDEIRIELQKAEFRQWIADEIRKAETTETVVQVPGGRSPSGKFDVLLLENRTELWMNEIFYFVVIVSSDRQRVLGAGKWAGDYYGHVPGSTRAVWNATSSAVAIYSYVVRRWTSFDLYRVRPSIAEYVPVPMPKERDPEDPPKTEYELDGGGPRGWISESDFMHSYRVKKTLQRPGQAYPEIDVMDTYRTVRLVPGKAEVRDLAQSKVLSEQYEAADNELNAAYKYAMKDLEGRERDELRAAQRKWIRDRNAQVEKLKSEKRLRKLIELTRQRSRELSEIILQRS